MRLVLLAIVMTLMPALSHAECAPTAERRAELLALADARFELADPSQRGAHGLAMIDCLADPDPALRDGVAFEALATWMREPVLDEATLDALRVKLLAALADPVDPLGVRRSFVALTLAELSRVDRIAPHLDAEQRQSLVDASIGFIGGVTDYRGFDDAVGWRHQAAHGADWVLQLILNPGVDAGQAGRLLTALATQIAPPGVAYHHGEPERIARAVFFAHQRGVLGDDFWDAWFADLAKPAPFASWAETGRSEAGLTRRHNLMNFLLALHFAATSREGSVDQALRRRALGAIEAISG